MIDLLFIIWCKCDSVEFIHSGEQARSDGRRVTTHQHTWRCVALWEWSPPACTRVRLRGHGSNEKSQGNVLRGLCLRGETWLVGFPGPPRYLRRKIHAPGLPVHITHHTNNGLFVFPFKKELEFKILSGFSKIQKN